MKVREGTLNEEALKFFSKMGFNKFESDYISLERKLD